MLVNEGVHKNDYFSYTRNDHEDFTTPSNQQISTVHVLSTNTEERNPFDAKRYSGFADRSLLKIFNELDQRNDRFSMQALGSAGRFTLNTHQSVKTTEVCEASNDYCQIEQILEEEPEQSDY